ncbi:MAG: DUF362 domain-containing protein [Dehalococcoidales bacterium]|nr:DUF362 domain-containing protein [Dehalococcoidales bacterium]
MRKQGKIVDSTVGKAELDNNGSAIGAVRMDPDLSYSGLSLLLKEVIDQNSKEAWAKIKAKIDYTYSCLTYAMDALEAEKSFSKEVQAGVKKGQKLLFKPNIVGPVVIDRTTHGAGNGYNICTNWVFVAALMRWFHDKLDISYYRMSLGEAGSAVSTSAAAFTRALDGKKVITSEALLEGRSGDFYGGWGFYFARKYLAEVHDPSHIDNPMNGYEESVAGSFIPPGRVTDKLMIYDLNKIADDRSNGRDVPVKHGVNFKTITLHKAIIGGTPGDTSDQKDYPGCVLINVPKLKVHDIVLLTNAIKNLGIGLYPMEANESNEPGKMKWKYACPHRNPPGMKNLIPHSVWVAELDETLMPYRDGQGQYIVTKTGGISATMADIIEAVKSQDIHMLHVVDAIETSNYSNGAFGDKKVIEGYAFASADPLAVDVLCGRYLFTTVPMAEARNMQKKLNLPSDFLQSVPIPKSDGRNIITEKGYDSPTVRYHKAFQYFQEKGLGQQAYYVVGTDACQSGKLASFGGHLGRIEKDTFFELLTREFYFSLSKPLWDLQATALSYAEASDALTRTKYKQALFDTFDENGDGVIDYDETGKKGWSDVSGTLGGYSTYLPSAEIGRGKFFKGSFLIGVAKLRCIHKEWNSEGHDLATEREVNSVLVTAMQMSQVLTESADAFFPSMTWGKGKWPSIQFARYVQLSRQFYGAKFPNQFDTSSLYGMAFRYADMQWGENGYTGQKARAESSDLIGRYHKATAIGAKLLPFVLYVPSGYGKVNGKNIPNVQETADPSRLFTVDFDGGSEAWRELSFLTTL